MFVPTCTGTCIALPCCLGHRLSFNKPRYSSLEEIHIFVLAHVLHRPIIVVADEFLCGTDGERLSPIYIGGIYLPMLFPAHKCKSKVPLLLAYDALHFSALAPVDEMINLLDMWKPSNQELRKKITGKMPISKGFLRPHVRLFLFLLLKTALGKPSWKNCKPHHRDSNQGASTYRADELTTALWCSSHSQRHKHVISPTCLHFLAPTTTQGGPWPQIFSWGVPFC